MKVLVFGTFDIIHPGHRDFFKQAREYGDQLIVCVARDVNVQKIKGHLPKNNELIRLTNLEKESLINEALLGDLHDPYKNIERIRPDIICLGYDQKSFTHDLKQELKKRNIQCRIIRLQSYFPKKYKTSKLMNKIIIP